jgi:hypothetical protein
MMVRVIPEVSGCRHACKPYRSLLSGISGHLYELKKYIEQTGYSFGSWCYLRSRTISVCMACKHAYIR